MKRNTPRLDFVALGIVLRVGIALGTTDWVAINRGGGAEDPLEQSSSQELHRLKDQHRVTQARVAVLESDIATMEREKKKTDELSAAIVAEFTLTPATTVLVADSHGHVALNITSGFATSLCRTAGVASVVQLDWYPGHVSLNATLPSPSGRTLVHGCPGSTGWQLIEQVPQVPADCAACVVNYTVCPRLELFNVLLDDVLTSWAAPPANASELSSTLDERGNPCAFGFAAESLQLLAPQRVDQPTIWPGCSNGTLMFQAVQHAAACRAFMFY